LFKTHFRLAELVLIAVAALSLLVAVAPARARPRDSLTATFTIHFPKGHPASNAPCDPDAFCGVGAVAGHGPATISILDETFDEVPGSQCLAVTRIERIDLLDGSGSLALESAGTFCRPGGSGNSHASNSSYGFPGRFDLRFTVVAADSSGIYAGAWGDGTETMDVDGGSGVWHLDGVVHR
jgi:hypothetical protein